MSGYQFSLEKVLGFRESKEDEIRLKVTELEASQAREEYKLTHLLNESRKTKAERLFETSMDAMRQQTMYQEVTDYKIIQQKLVVEKAAAHVLAAKEDLIEAHKEKKVLEKLKEKDLASYIENEQHAEQKFLDELSVLHHGRSFI